MQPGHQKWQDQQSESTYRLLVSEEVVRPSEARVQQMRQEVPRAFVLEEPHAAQALSSRKALELSRKLIAGDFVP